MATALDTGFSCLSDGASAPLRLISARSLEDVDALEAPWNAWRSRVDNPLAQFIWTRAALAAFAADAAPRIVAAVRGDQLLAIAPLVRRRVRGIWRVCLAGVGHLFEPMDLFSVDEAALKRVIGRLALIGTPLLLERIPEESNSLQALRRAYRWRALMFQRRQPNCPYIELDDSWVEPETHLNSGRRSDLRRARRKAEQLGPVTTEIHTPDLCDLPRLLDTAFEVEALSWKGAEGTALAHDADRAVFYRQYAQAACVEGILRIGFLRIGNRVAAMQLAIEHGSGFWLLKVGYDERFATCSPGMLLMRETIRYAAEAGLRTYEFLGHAETWTRIWTKTERSYVSLHVYPIGVRGLSALAADAVASSFNRWRSKRCSS